LVGAAGGSRLRARRGQRGRAGAPAAGRQVSAVHRASAGGPGAADRGTALVRVGRVLSEAFVAAMARLAALPDSRCSEPWVWPGHSGWPLQVRDALYRSLEEELEGVAAHAAPATE